ncbi:MAG TPA: hypothetical protein VF815_17145 [Myxococcaceae bacterium]
MSILAFGTKHDPKVEADVILTSAILGFCVTRLKLGQPFSFDIEHPPASVVSDPGKYQEFLEDWQKFLHVLSALASVLEFNGLKADFLRDDQSRAWHPEARITGREGGAMIKPQERHKPMLSPQAISLGKDEHAQPGGYFGRGAYTGMIDDPVNHKTYRQPTKRIVVVDQDRWRPEMHKSYPGLIRGPKDKGAEFINLDKDLKKGMGPFNEQQEQDLSTKGGIVGYVHGMSWAMQECIKCGPWCTPYEQAVGSDTTKMASCFPCTTYMYAAGFPPSSIHLGRGESWCPLPENQSSPYGEIAQSLNTRWHAQVFHYLELGRKCLEKFANAHRDDSGIALTMGRRNTLKVKHVSVGPQLHVAKAHRDALDAMEYKLHTLGLAKGGNLMLDALTVHESEWKRVYNTLHAEQLNKGMPQPGDDLVNGWTQVTGKRGSKPR